MILTNEDLIDLGIDTAVEAALGEDTADIDLEGVTTTTLTLLTATAKMMTILNLKMNDEVTTLDRITVEADEVVIIETLLQIAHLRAVIVTILEANGITVMAVEAAVEEDIGTIEVVDLIDTEMINIQRKRMERK